MRAYSSFCGQPCKRKRVSRDNYTIAIIVPLAVELVPVRSALDAIHDDISTMRTFNSYILGEIGRHNVVVATLPATGNSEAGSVATQLLNDFPNIILGLLVGVGGGVPGSVDIRLGDIVVSESVDSHGAVIQLDRGKNLGSETFLWTGHLNNPHTALAATVKNLRAQHTQSQPQIGRLVADMIRRYPNMKSEYRMPDPVTDRLFEATYEHVGIACTTCDSARLVQRTPRTDRHPRIHYGPVGSSNALIRSGTEREKLRKRFNILSVEMEAAGLMHVLPCLVIRGICDYADSHKNKAWQPYAAANAAAYMKELLLVLSPIQIHSSRSGHTRDVSIDSPSLEMVHFERSGSITQALVQSLAFDRMDARLHNIEDAHPQTCKWIFHDEQFKTWMQRKDVKANHGFFWIKGKPGSGKSTVMKSVLEQLEVQSHEEVLLSYFFNARSPGQLEKSSFGLYRSLVHQILHAYPDTKGMFVKRFRSKYRIISTTPPGSAFTIDEWSEIELKNFLSSVVKLLRKNALNLFIDALDEGEESDVRGLVNFLENLALSALEHKIRLRICLSSRHFPQIRIKRALSVILEHHPGHSTDIENYVHEKLEDVDDDNGDLKSRVCQKSAMVFLWVVLVIPLLRRAYDRGRTTEMSRCLEELPQDLETLFDEIMLRNLTDIDQCYKLLHIVLFARRPLTQPELFIAIQLYETKTSSVLDEIPSDLTLNRYIVDCSRGFVELTRSSPPTVQFVHELVRTFLQRRVYQWVVGDQSESWEGGGHNALKSICFRYIHLRSTSDQTWLLSSKFDDLGKYRYSVSNKSGQHDFDGYVAEHLFAHADIASRCGIRQHKFLEDFIANTCSNTGVAHIIPRMRLSYLKGDPPECSLLLSLVNKDCANLVRDILEIMEVCEVSKHCLTMAIINALPGRTKEFLCDVRPRFGIQTSDDLALDILSGYNFVL